MVAVASASHATRYHSFCKHDQAAASKGTPEMQLLGGFLTPRERAVAFIFSMLVHPGVLETITSSKQNKAGESKRNIIGNI